MAAVAAAQQPAMAASYESVPPPQSSSLTARRPAANNLPSMIELPMPPFGNQISKPVPVTNMHPTPTAQTNVGNLLTPPSTVPGDGLSPLSAVMTTSSSAPQAMPSYGGNMSSWLPPPPTVTSPLGMGSGTGTTPSTWAGSMRSGMFSPSLFSTVPGNNQAPSNRTEGVPPPPYDMSQLPPFSASSTMSAPATLPAISQQSQQQQQQQQQSSLAYANQAHSSVHAQGPGGLSSPSTLAGTDSYMSRPHSTPTLYASASQQSSAVQSTFPPFHVNTPPIQQSPMSAPLMNTRISPITPQGSTFSPSQSSPYGYRNQMGSYPLPSLNGPQSAPLGGPMMSNMHTPNNQMAMMGLPTHSLASGVLQGVLPITSGQAAAQIYGNLSQQPPNERPFKCDVCPQSFNRNHDLKRHKRIHLAVKPFPCLHCDKSFSRKDALKRHILVKGCGKNLKDDRRSRHDSPDAKSESSEDSVMSAGGMKRSV